MITKSLCCVMMSCIECIGTFVGCVRACVVVWCGMVGDWGWWCVGIVMYSFLFLALPLLLTATPAIRELWLSGG